MTDDFHIPVVYFANKCIKWDRTVTNTKVEKNTHRLYKWKLQITKYIPTKDKKQSSKTSTTYQLINKFLTLPLNQVHHIIHTYSNIFQTVQTITWSRYPIHSSFLQFSKLLTFAEDNDIASTPYNMKGMQYDFNNSTVTISEFWPTPYISVF